MPSCSLFFFFPPFDATQWNEQVIFFFFVTPCVQKVRESLSRFVVVARRNRDVLCICIYDHQDARSFFLLFIYFFVF